MAKLRQGRPYRRRRLAIIASSGGVCAICGKPLGAKVHVDHVKPVAFGGTDTRDNLRATHPSCNMARGVKPSGFDRPLSRDW